MFERFLSIPWALNMLGLEYTRVAICQYSVERFSVFSMSWDLNLLRFWMYQESKYAILKGLEYYSIFLTGFWIYHAFKICQNSEYIRVLNMSGFIKKMLHHKDDWQGSDYFSGFAYTRVLNIPWSHKVLKKMMHHRWLTGFQILFRFWTCNGYKHAKVTQGSEQNALLLIFDRVLIKVSRVLIKVAG